MKWHTFTTRIEKIGFLRCVIVPPHIVKALGSAMRIPVLARYGGETTLSTLARGRREASACFADERAPSGQPRCR